MTRVKATWLRSQVVKLGDGLAVTFSDISEAKATAGAICPPGGVYGFGLSERSLQHRRDRYEWTDYGDECGGGEADGLQPGGAGGEGSADGAA